MAGYYIRTEEHKRYMRDINIGRHHTKESIAKMSLSKIGKPSKTKGIARSDEVKEKLRVANLGKKASQETKLKMSLSRKGRHNWWMNKPLSEETKRKMSESRKGVKHSEEHNRKIGLANKNRVWTDEAKNRNREAQLRLYANGYKSKKIGTHPSKEARIKMTLSRIGEKNHQWKGGISWYPYTNEFNRQLKELIRDRDSHICQQCGVPEIELINQLHVHHIDYQKWNCLPTNLISLCGKCHVSTNTNRTYWTTYFTTLLNRRTLKVVNK